MQYALRSRKVTKMQKRIAVDLTPILPGGTNGGAKIMTLQLLKHLGQIAPHYMFILLTSKANYSELSELKAPNIEISPPTLPRLKRNTLFLMSFGFLFFMAGKLLKKILPNSLKARLAYMNQRLFYKIVARNLAPTIKADLLFCPFTAPFYRDLDVPIVSVVYDLQSHYHPYFFDATDHFFRRKNFEDACKTANTLVCISNFVKQTILEKSTRLAENVKTIYIRLAHRLPSVASQQIKTVLDQYQLTEQHYLLYPANFWAHKNHFMLFTAMGMYKAAHPTSSLKLVCTGADDAQKAFLYSAIQDFGLSDTIIMPGYLSDQEFGSLLTSCKAVIFPSLYEGFGMPVLEAMASGKPVLCSNTTSLPEVAGNAAIFFDPRKPDQIVDAIAHIEQNPTLMTDLIQKGQDHLARFGTEIDMANEYMNIFDSVLQKDTSL